MSGFYSAREARNTALNKRPVLDEIRTIEPYILNAVEAGLLRVIVGPGGTPALNTGFTNNTVFYQAYSDPTNYKTDAHKVATAQMNEVISYFQEKGYIVTRERNSGQTNFNWVINW